MNSNLLPHALPIALRTPRGATRALIAVCVLSSAQPVDTHAACGQGPAPNRPADRVGSGSRSKPEAGTALTNSHEGEPNGIQAGRSVGQGTEHATG